jgi:hypothetical protein
MYFLFENKDGEFCCYGGPIFINWYLSRLIVGDVEINKH